MAATIVPEGLALFLTLLLCIENRNLPACRYGLRLVAINLDDREAVRFTQLLVNTCSPSDRYWLRNILGERPEPVRPSDATPDDLPLVKTEN